MRQDRIEELEGQFRDATAENERLQNQFNQAQREVHATARHGWRTGGRDHPTAIRPAAVQ